MESLSKIAKINARGSVHEQKKEHRLASRDESDEEEESSAADTSDEDDDEEDSDAEQVEQLLTTPTKAATTRNRKKVDNDIQMTKKKKNKRKAFVLASAGDRYLVGTGSSSKTSDTLLSTYLRRPFTAKSYDEALGETEVKDEVEEMFRYPEESMLRTFTRWAWDLDEGFGVLVYGFGSKRRQLNEFAAYLRKHHGSVVVVDGFDPDVSLAGVLSALEALVSPSLVGHTPHSQHERRVRNLLIALEKRPTRRHRNRPLNIIVHSLDKGPLALPRTLSVLSTLAAHPQIRFTASVDHVRSLLLFPSSMVFDLPHVTTTDSQRSSLPRTFSFVFHELSTLSSYTTEVKTTLLLPRLLPDTIFEPPSHGHSASHSTLASTQFVLYTVTSSSRQLVLLLAQLQLAEADSTAGMAPQVPLATLQGKAIEQMLALSAPQVESLLSEFRDHGVVRDGENDGVKTVGIALRVDELTELLDREGDGMGYV